MIDALRARLERHADPARAAAQQAYLKSDLVFLGATLPQVRVVAREILATKPDREALKALVDACWATRVHDLRAVAVVLLEKRSKLLISEDITWLEGLLRDAHTWAYVDAIAAHTVGALVERDPGLGSTLDRWATDPDFWIRRSAMLALLGPLRRGGGDLDRFLRYGDAMLEEKGFFIRKAIGWILREIGRKRPEVVRDWLIPRVGRCSGVTLREALKPLSEPDRERVRAGVSAAAST